MPKKSRKKTSVKKAVKMPQKEQNVVKKASTRHKRSLSALATLGPIGYFPKGSGTVGSLVALPIAYLLSITCLPLLWIATVLLALVGTLAIHQFTANKKDKDPGCVIIDEVVGQLITFAVIIPAFMHWPVLLIGFLLFRFFDIFKFGPVAFWDRREDAIGVMMDDVSAGIISAFILAMMQAMTVEFLF